ITQPSQPRKNNFRISSSPHASSHPRFNPHPYLHHHPPLSSILSSTAFISPVFRPHPSPTLSIQYSVTVPLNTKRYRMGYRIVAVAGMPVGSNEDDVKRILFPKRERWPIHRITFDPVKELVYIQFDHNLHGIEAIKFLNKKGYTAQWSPTGFGTSTHSSASPGVADSSPNGSPNGGGFRGPVAPGFHGDTFRRYIKTPGSSPKLKSSPTSQQPSPPIPTIPMSTARATTVKTTVMSSVRAFAKEYQKVESVFVSPIPTDITRPMLWRLLETYGKVKGLRLHKRTGQAFADYFDMVDATNCVENFERDHGFPANWAPHYAIFGKNQDKKCPSVEKNDAVPLEQKSQIQKQDVQEQSDSDDQIEIQDTATVVTAVTGVTEPFADYKSMFAQQKEMNQHYKELIDLKDRAQAKAELDWMAERHELINRLAIATDMATAERAQHAAERQDLLNRILAAEQKSTAGVNGKSDLQDAMLHDISTSKGHLMLIDEQMQALHDILTKYPV
ncbi:hypothetical protein BZA05DRAFT_454096, partial [Tricharina praecox]|uniref:uncharacterized protein n=1 Tax=Tricharina praecox TaxID=43433 RepID=UPI00221F5CA9